MDSTVKSGGWPVMHAAYRTGRRMGIRTVVMDLSQKKVSSCSGEVHYADTTSSCSGVINKVN